MNYLGHYVYNHRILKAPRDPYFILGAALPDLWARFSRRRRLRWKAVRSATPRDPQVKALREGLLNHVEVDRRFHSLAIFNGWQNELKLRLCGARGGSSVLDFIVHISLELALDHRILVEQPDVGVEIYDRASLCDLQLVERELSELGDVDTRGLAEEVRRFAARRFLTRLRDLEVIPLVIDFVLGLMNVREKPAAGILAAASKEAVNIVAPELVWAEMTTMATPDNARLSS